MFSHSLDPKRTPGDESVDALVFYLERRLACARMKKPVAVYTIGYEGRELSAFLAKLIDEGVRLLVDVRELPLSRKKGFSKRTLEKALGDHGIRYLHVRELGCPKAIRDSYKIDGDWKKYVRAFCSYLERQGTPLATVAQRARDSRACLMCFEMDFTRCHRSIVADALARKSDVRIVHLRP
jgi:uncharacterized protein (DUF488 family)